MVSPDPLSPMRCPRCERSLEKVGTHSFAASSDGGTLSAMGAMFPKSTGLDVYLCLDCGRVEFFVDGVAERAHD
jgi:hypothetical protein